jgi:putative membrane protein
MSKSFASATTMFGLGLLSLTACASKAPGPPPQPMSQNLPPAVASPSPQAFAPLSTSPYEGMSEGATAPTFESDPDVEQLAKASREPKRRVEARSNFHAETNRAEGTMAPLPSNASTVAVAPGLSDGQIVRITETMQNAEISEARVVASRANDARVKQFAEQLLEDNKALKAQHQDLAKSTQITPAESSLSADLRVKSSQELTSVELARPEDFDQEFIENQVEQGSEMLQIMNERLIPDATSPKLKAELTRSRAVIERQLDEARDIKRSLDTTVAPIDK